MKTIPSGFLALATGMLRHPTFYAEFSWGNHISSGGWFRLDTSQLDGDDRLTLTSYLESQEVEEIITEIDQLIYTDESEYVGIVEGLEEIIGDNDQYSISELDIQMVNDTGRFWPRYNKNRLENPSFEDSFEKWSPIASGGALISIGDEVVSCGTRSSSFISNGGLAALFSSPVALYSGQTSETAQDWTFSYYTQGSGTMTPKVYLFGPDHVTASGNLHTDLVSTTVGTPVTLSSGGWTRDSESITAPSGTHYMRVEMILSTASGNWMYNDHNQFEYGTLTDYDCDFIGDEILPKRAVRVQVGFDYNHISQFVGYTEQLNPSLRNQTIDIHALDPGRRLQEVKVISGMFEDMRTDEIIEYLASGEGGIDPSMYTLESGTVNVPFVWFQEGSIWYYMKQAAEAEGGRVFFNEEGVLEFWNKNHISQDVDVSWEFDFEDEMIDIDFSVDNTKVRNFVTVIANPREAQASQVIYTEDSYIQVDPGESVEYWATFDDPAYTVSTPVASTDWDANTASDGTGSDITADVSLAFDPFARSAKLTFTNNNASTAYILNLQIEGEPATVIRKINVEAEDEESQLLYGTQTLQIENDWIQNEEYAQALAEQKLAELKDPKDFVTIECVGLPFLQPGDKVQIQNYYDGSTRELTIMRNRWQITDEFIQRFQLQNRNTI